MMRRRSEEAPCRLRVGRGVEERSRGLHGLLVTGAKAADGDLHAWRYRADCIAPKMLPSVSLK
jgi:hypothetical protein